MTDPDERTRRLAAEAGDDPTGWFERLYAAAEQGEAVVPWDRGGPHPLLSPWTAERALAGGGRSALVVGCGFGADAEHVAGLGFATTAFDISESAVRAARRRFPDSAVQYVTADLLEPPAGWRGGFDLVLESLTVQSLPDPPRREAIGRVRDMVAPGGTLLVLASARDEQDGPVEGPPWPLTRAEIDAFATAGLEPVRVEDVRDAEAPRRWRAEFRRT
jgi:SAM-dependent methyltransferase